MTLNKKYARLAVKNAFVFSLLTVMTLLLFQNQIPAQTTWITLGYGILSFIVEAPLFYLSFKNHWEDGEWYEFRWLILPLLSFVCLTLVSIIYSSIAYGYNPIDYFYLNGVFSKERVFNHIQYVLFGVVLVFGLQMLGAGNIREIVINKARTASPGSDDEQIVHLQGNTKNNSVKLNIRDFLYAESDANYARILYLKNGEVASETLRITIKQLEERLSEFENITRCHRAYIVNTAQIAYLEGTCVKSEAHFLSTGVTIPVSKTYYKAVTDRLN